MSVMPRAKKREKLLLECPLFGRFATRTFYSIEHFLHDVQQILLGVLLHPQTILGEEFRKLIIRNRSAENLGERQVSAQTFRPDQLENRQVGGSKRKMRGGDHVRQRARRAERSRHKEQPGTAADKESSFCAEKHVHPVASGWMQRIVHDPTHPWEWPHCRVPHANHPPTPAPYFSNRRYEPQYVAVAERLCRFVFHGESDFPRVDCADHLWPWPSRTRVFSPRGAPPP